MVKIRGSGAVMIRPLQGYMWGLYRDYHRDPPSPTLPEALVGWSEAVS